MVRALQMINHTRPDEAAVKERPRCSENKGRLDCTDIDMGRRWGDPKMARAGAPAGVGAGLAI